MQFKITMNPGIFLEQHMFIFGRLIKLTTLFVLGGLIMYFDCHLCVHHWQNRWMQEKEEHLLLIGVPLLYMSGNKRRASRKECAFICSISGD